MVLNSPTGCLTFLPLSSSLSAGRQACGELQVGGHVWGPAGGKLGLLFLEEPPFGFPSVRRWGRTDLSYNLCADCRAGSWLKITRVEADGYVRQS